MHRCEKLHWVSWFFRWSPCRPWRPGKYNKVVSVGDKAPDFAGLPAVEHWRIDTSLTLSDIKEDVVVLVFLGNHCPVVRGTKIV